MTSAEYVFEAQSRAVTAPLDAAALLYSVLQTPKGLPYATFRWRTDGLPALNCTAVLYGGAWRLTAHETSVPEPRAYAEKGTLLSSNGRLPLVRGLFDTSGDEFRAVLSLRLRPHMLNGTGLIDLLVHLATSVAFLRAEVADPPPLPVLAPDAESDASRDGAPALPAQVSSPMPGWREIVVADTELAWNRLAANPALADRLHDWTPVGTLVDLDGHVAARITTLAREPGLPEWAEFALDDAHRLLAAARRALEGSDTTGG
ncbi:MAG: hypothetical protein QM695_16090 [Micropruina sp.]